jgi:hypothetical protein
MSRHFGISNPAVLEVSQASNLVRPTDPQAAPVAAGQSISTFEDTAVNIVLTASDANGDLLSYAVVAGPSNGGLTGTAPNLIYTPNANYNGSDSFTFKANDGTADSAVATVSITVTAVNDNPVANAQSVSVLEDGYVTITLTGSDIDGNPLTYTVVAGPSNGGLTGTAPNLIYTPNANYNGSDSFAFRVNDGYVSSSAATVSITVTAVNDNPVATAQSVSVSHNTATAITLAGSDVEGSALTYTVVTNPTNGSLTGTAPNLTYTPNSGYSGSDSFTFRVNDGTADSAAATVTLTVAAAGDASFANVSLLLKADGANNSTTFVDSSTNAFAVSRTGNTVISTAQSKYGGSSMYFDGSGDYLSLGTQAAAAPFGLGTGNFTIEAWIKPDSTANNGTIYGNYGRALNGANRAGSHVIRLLSGRIQLYVFITSTAFLDLQSTSTIPTNAWTHIAITRSGTTFMMFVNGVLERTLTSGVNLTSDPVKPPTAGAYWQTASAIEPTSYFNGYIDDFRITKGVARYTASFGPPDSHPTSGT